MNYSDQGQAKMDDTTKQASAAARKGTRMVGADRALRMLLVVVVAMLSVVSLSPAQTLGQAKLDWRQRFLGILPLVKPDAKDPVIAVADGKQITLAQVDSYAKTEARLINATTTNETRAVWRDALDNLVNRTLLAEEARRRKIQVPEQEVAARARGFHITSASGETVASNGAPEQQMLEEVGDSLRIERMLDEIFKTAKVAPTKAQIEKYYNDHKDLFVSDPGQVRISHIAVKIPPNATPDLKRVAEQRINKLYKDAAKAKDFAALARENSDDAQSAQKGGDLGYFRPGQLPPVVEKQAFATKVGHLSSIIASNIGYSFMKVTERSDAKYAALKDVRSKIALVLLNYNEDDAVRDLLRKLHKNAKIEFRNPPNRPT